MQAVGAFHVDCCTWIRTRFAPTHHKEKPRPGQGGAKGLVREFHQGLTR